MEVKHLGKLGNIIKISTDLMAFHSQYSGKKVILTGHTGFKGSWMAEWLTILGAKVYGFALDPLPEAIFYDQLGLNKSLAGDVRADIRDYDALKKLIGEVDPDFIFHLAAQPLVRYSYDIPVETFAVNVMGSIHLMEAVRETGIACTVVMITTDKCYENREWLHAYREEEAMGGYDPYSASKGAAEIAISSYRRSFFSSEDGKVKVVSARAGNVIGGGDWAQDRIIPDCIKAIKKGEHIAVRNKIATRPWQHVLEPISGYLWLGAVIDNPALVGRDCAEELIGGFNFGPALTSNKTVEQLVVELLKHCPGDWKDCSDPDAVHEASKLNLAIDKAFHLLEWRPVWGFEETIDKTASWYRDAEESDIPTYTRSQIEQYTADAARLALNWSK
ncbi:MAG: CDP-glucose 4,6-dehydratase [Akkermansiaceae bacterium]